MATDLSLISQEIRRLLMSVRAEGHTEAEEKNGVCNYSTDALRAKVLREAGVCPSAYGEMMPNCGCPVEERETEK